MGLSGSLQVGRSGLLTSQAALQVTGNNLANVSTRGYHRQTIDLSPAGSTRLHTDAYLGRGVQLDAITREVDEALEARLRTAIADESFTNTRHELLAQVEALQNELTDTDISSKLGKFFDAWSNLANNPQDASLRTLVIEEGATLADTVRTMRGDLSNLRGQVDQQAKDAARNVDDLLSRIEDLNERIAVGGGAASSGSAGLKDERDALLQELGEYLGISTVAHPNGVVDVFVGSLPIVLNGRSRGVELTSEVEGGDLQIELRIKDDRSPLDLTGGKLASMIKFRKDDLQGAMDTLDTFAAQLITQVNRVHSQGQGLKGSTSIVGATQVLDSTLPLTDPDAGLDFPPGHGSFQVHVTQKSTGQRVTSTVSVDADGIDPANDTSLDDLIASLGGVANVTATRTADGRLRIASTSQDFEISFSDDTSGALASLGINTYFTGKDAGDIDINARIKSDASLLAAAQGHLPGDNRNTLAMVALRDKGVSELGGQSLTGFWGKHVETLAIQTSQAQQAFKADQIVRENLEEQQQQVSGVNADEEAINLMQFQRSYQASARFISVVDELMSTLLNMV